MNKFVKHNNKSKEATGPLHTLDHICQDLWWSINKDFIMTRANGGKISFLKGEDKIFTHLIRMDLRKAVWKKNKELNKPEKNRLYEADKGIVFDYETTTKATRAKFRKISGTERPNKEGADLPTGIELEEKKKMTNRTRGLFRQMTEGGIWTGHKMKSAGLRKTAVCPICKNHADEDEEHVIWGCQEKI